MRRVLIAGCGYVGRTVAQNFCRAGWEVIGLTHSHRWAENLASHPYRVMACDIANRAELESMQPEFGEVDAVIDCVSSGHGGADVYRRIYLEGVRNLLEICHPARFVFTSSTSVYAQTDGSWVTEVSPAQPERETGRILRETEELTLLHGGIVARLAGIYGPGRSMLIHKLLERTAVIEGEGSRYINQIHRDDAAAALFFLIDREVLSGIYNVVDDRPMTQLDCYRWLAERFRKSMPPTGPIDETGKRGWTSKRVSNTRLRQLGWQCKYPSFPDAVINDSDLLTEFGKSGKWKPETEK